MPTFSSFEEENKKTTVEYDLTDKQSKGAFLSKVFGMMFLCLLITTVVAAGLGYGFLFLLNATAQDGVLCAKFTYCVLNSNKDLMVIPTELSICN